jgi:DNA modification methylase
MLKNVVIHSMELNNEKCAQTNSFVEVDLNDDTEIVDSIFFIVGSCFEIQNYPQIPVNLILFDPPYKDYEQPRKKNRITHKIKGWAIEQFKTLIQLIAENHLLAKDGWLIYKCDDDFMFKTYHVVSQFFEFRRKVTWDKGRISTGGEPRLRHENLLFFYNCGTKPFTKIFPPRIKSKWHGGSQGRSFPSVINVYAPNGGEYGSDLCRTHTNQTPKKLWELIIDFFCPQNGLVLDPCCGTGSIAAAVQSLNRFLIQQRHYHGIEIVPSNIVEAQNILVRQDKLYDSIGWCLGCDHLRFLKDNQLCRKKKSIGPKCDLYCACAEK